jgi:hypothetical protein
VEKVCSDDILSPICDVSNDACAPHPSGFEGDEERIPDLYAAVAEVVSGGVRSMAAMVAGALSCLTPERGKCIDN